MAKTSIYFCGSIRGGRDDAAFYAKIIQHLKQHGDVLTEHVGNCGPDGKVISELNTIALNPYIISLKDSKYQIYIKVTKQIG